MPTKSRLPGYLTYAYERDNDDDGDITSTFGWSLAFRRQASTHARGSAPATLACTFRCRNYASPQRAWCEGPLHLHHHPLLARFMSDEVLVGVPSTPQDISYGRSFAVDGSKKSLHKAQPEQCPHHPTMYTRNLVGHVAKSASGL
jgi:hypothetical protein